MTPEIVSSSGALALVAVLSYLLGAIPFGVVIAHLFGLGDLRKIGSGNIGATNVLRTGNRVAAALTLILDAGKGGIAVLIARALLAEDAAQLAGLCTFLGHLYPVWLGFRGGKGVATFLGIVLALNPLLGALACLSWLATAALTRLSSLSALVATAATPLVAMLMGYSEAALLLILLALLIYARHAPNIRRIWTGEEPRIGQKRKS